VERLGGDGLGRSADPRIPVARQRESVVLVAPAETLNPALSHGARENREAWF
jgi:hypothetical protein